MYLHPPNGFELSGLGSDRRLLRWAAYRRLLLVNIPASQVRSSELLGSLVITLNGTGHKIVQDSGFELVKFASAFNVDEPARFSL